MRKLFLALLACAALTARAQNHGKFSVVINELASRGAVGGDRAVELYNYGPARALTGWKLAYYSGGAAQTVYTLPAFTLGRHAFVTVHFDLGTNTATDLYTGFTLGGLGANGELRLDDNSGGVFAAVDYVRWGTTSTGGIGASLTWTGSLAWGSSCRLTRSQDLNTRSAADWTVDCTAKINPFGQLNDGQAGYRRHSRVMINEFQQDGTPWVELYNPNPVAVNTAGLTLTLYDGGTTPCASLPFDGAAGDPPSSMTAGQLVAIDITGCTWYTLAAGALDGEIQIAGPGEVEGIDYVAFNNPVNRNQSTSVQWTGGDLNTVSGTLACNARRQFDLDSDNANDWARSANGDANKGALSANQFGPLAYGEPGAETVAASNTDADGSSRGVQVLMTRGIFLRQFGMRLNVTAVPRDVTMAILKESTPGSGSWASAYQSATTAVTAAEDGNYGFRPGVALQPGERYLLGLYVNNTFSYYRDALNDAFPYGTIEGQRGDVNYLPGGGAISLGALSANAPQQFWGFEVGPDLTTAALADGEVGLAYSLTLVASAGTGTQSWSATGLPAGLTLNAATGALTGTPSASGSFTPVVTLTDANGVYSRRAYSMTIYPAILVTTTTLPNGEQGVAYSQTLALTGGSGTASWTVQGGALPAGLTLSSGGVLSGTPTVTGPFNFTVRATDSLGAFDNQALTLTVATPLAITTGAVLPDGAVNLAYGQALATAGGTGAVTWTLTAGALPAGVTLSGGGLVAGTPSASGSFTFTATATDGASGTASRQFWLYSEAAFGIRNGGLAVGYLKHAYAQTLVAGGGTPPYSFSISAGALPGGLALSSAGAITGTPSSTGSFPVTFQVTDANGTPRVATRAFTLSVLQQPDLPQWGQRGLYGGTVSEIDFSPNYATDGTVFLRGRALELYRHRPADLDAAGNWTWSLLPVDAGHLYGTISDLALSPNFDMNQVGGGEAGRTVMVALDYGVGASAIYKSTDQGATFAPAVTGLPAGRPSQLAFSPTYATDATLWVTLYDALASHLTVQLSTDRAASWSPAADLTTQLGLSNLTADDLAAAGAQTLFLAAGSKLYRSTDAGVTWSGPLLTLSGQPRLLVSPQFSSDHTVMVIASGAVYRSRNEGSSFSALGALAGVDAGAVTGRPGGNTPQWIFYDNNSAAPRLLRSLDGGDSFVPLNPFGVRYSGGVIGAARPATANGASALLAGSTWGADLSVDGGLSWNPQDGGMHAIKFNSLCDGTYYYAATTDLGFFKSADLGLSWVFYEAGSDGVPAAPGGFGECAISPNHGSDGILFLEASGALYRSADGGQSFTAVLGGQSDILAIALQPGFSGAAGSTKQAVWVASNLGVYKSADAGATFTPVTLPAGCGTPGALWIDGIAISPNYGGVDNTVFVGTGALCKTVDAGGNWTVLAGSGGKSHVALSSTYNETNATKRLVLVSTDGHPKYSTDGGTTIQNAAIPGGYLYADRVFLSPFFPVDGRAYYISADMGAGQAGLYVSPDFGATISRVAYPPDQLATRKVTGFAFGPTFYGGNTTSTATAVTDGSGIFRSTDSGASFLPAGGTVTATLDVKVAAVIPPDATATTSRLPPGALLYGTEGSGVYRSIDGGATFRWFSRGLPAGALRALHVPLGAPGAPLAAVAANGIYRYVAASNDWQKAGGASGTFTDFTQDGGYVYAARADGRSLRSADQGATWNPISTAEQDLVNVEDVSLAGLGLAGGGKKVVGPRRVEGTTASLWGVSATAGPRYSTDSGTNWTDATGGNDYPLPSGQSWQVIQPMGINAVSGSRVVLAGSAAGLWRSSDGGDTWKRVDGAGSGLEATSKNFTAFLATATVAGTTDVLVGATGATTGGVFLSGDNGEHWTMINAGFDPANLSISTLVSASCAGCPVNYYSGSFGGGLYTRTIAVDPPPAITGWFFGSTIGACATAAPSGPVGGAQAFRLCGSGFKAGAVVEFGGVRTLGACTVVSALEITCSAAAGTPPHPVGPVAVRVRNSDTRIGELAQIYNYTGTGSRPADLHVAKSGADAALTWNCATCSAGNPPRLYRAQNAIFTIHPELFTNGLVTAYTDAGAVATAQSYFWSVE